ncbi:fumarylacetoacetate hydrolase family protein [Synechococcus sp. RSCCF101]|uniref:fumarylacetoacetate hydrolase family protein n=1 Tax=Synechococcus sp. RSCCF101 TaxID=2511069 RepID=UPI0012439F97|nr:fumarylacetoacetate hydrolase family protein [Synechococcus sp. RSCCF101]QEY32323.1 fumarylacetoacetate hydrolase family protein [Synechococcus sp. RSCCF101]
MTIFCLGRNHPDLPIMASPPSGAAEAASGSWPPGQEPDGWPLVAGKADSSLSGATSPIPITPINRQVDWEAELVLRIGTPAFQLPKIAAAGAVIEAWGVGNDVSDRWWQRRGGGQWVKGKSFPGFGPYSLKQLKAREPGPLDLDRELCCRLNGTVVQQGRLSEYIHPPEAVVWQLSQVLRLQPGDLIFCGTFPGSGFTREPKRFLKPGDELITEIEGLGRLVNPVQALSPPSPG